MIVKDLSLKGLKLIHPKKFVDVRGFFLESYRQPLYQKFGIDSRFIQDNLAYSKEKTIRGMHFQSRPGQDKLITVLSGKIFDVAVDIRPSSATFGKYHSIILDEISHTQFFIPHGFAHGYCVLSKSAYVQYKVSNIYDPSSEKGFRFDDPDIGIAWPVEEPLISERDLSAHKFSELNFQKWFS